MKFLRRIATGSIPISSASEVDHPLAQVRRLGPAGAAIGVGRHAIGQHADRPRGDAPGHL